MLSGQDLIRVGVDARPLNRAHLRGMGKYLWQLIARAGRGQRVRWELLANRPDLPFHRPPAEDADTHLFECRGYRFHAWEQFALPRRARRLGVDVLHCPATSLPWYQPVPTVVTLHDTIPWTFGGPGSHSGWYKSRLLPRAYRKCAALITISESSRRDILKLWPDLEEKTHVIPLGVGDEYLTAPEQPLSDSLRAMGIRQPYLLYVGGAIPRKRPDWAIRVLERMAQTDVTLVMCGVEPEAQDRLRQEAAPEVRQQLCFAPFIPETDVPNLYMNAVAVIYPTLYEGFGLPALEAQAVGTPVLFSDVSSLSELRGPGAVIVPPDDLDGWAANCRRLAAARAAAPQPDGTARAWASQFSWDTLSQRTMEVYRSAVRPRLLTSRRRGCRKLACQVGRPWT